MTIYKFINVENHNTDAIRGFNTTKEAIEYAEHLRNITESKIALEKNINGSYYTVGVY